MGFRGGELIRDDIMGRVCEETGMEWSGWGVLKRTLHHLTVLSGLRKWISLKVARC